MPIGKKKEPKPPKEKKVKAPKEKKPKKPKKARPPKGKKPVKGKNVPEGAEELEEGQQPEKKKLPRILLLIPPLVIAAAAAIIFFVVIPKLNADADPEATATAEPEPPALPSAIPIGDDVSIVGMTLEADESGAQAVKAKTVTYTYLNLNDAGKAAQTYAGQLAGESPAFAVVDEEFVRQRDKPDYTTAEGTVLLARNAPVEEPEEGEAEETPEPEASEDMGTLLGSRSGFDSGLLEPLPGIEPEKPISYVHTVRITWSPGMCVVTADEAVGEVTSPPPSTVSGGQSLSIRGAVKRLGEMEPAKLGLEGASMEEYELIPMDATEMVNGTACINVYVYNGKSAEQSNQFVGSYLMSIDGQHLYRLDPVTDEIIELEDYP